MRRVTRRTHSSTVGFLGTEHRHSPNSVLLGAGMHVRGGIVVEEARFTIVAETVNNTRKLVLRMKGIAEGVKEQAQRAHDASRELQDVRSIAQCADLADILGLESVAPPRSAPSEQRAIRTLDDISRFAQRVETVRNVFEELRWTVHQIALMDRSNRIAAGSIQGGTERLLQMYHQVDAEWQAALEALETVEAAAVRARHIRNYCELKGFVQGKSSRVLQFLRD
jgi:hypothetical protein